MTLLRPAVLPGASPAWGQFAPRPDEVVAAHEQRHGNQRPVPAAADAEARPHPAHVQLHHRAQVWCGCLHLVQDFVKTEEAVKQVCAL